MADYAIGDIQGCYEELCLLLDVIDFDTSADTLWIAGDLINRGPQSLDVLKLLFSIRANTKIVLGNHDLHFLAVAAGTRQPSKKDTIASIIDAPQADQLIAWLRQQPLLITCEERNLSMVHAGIPPMWDLATAKRLAQEVETCLQGPNWMAFTQAMYGNTPEQWHEELCGYERLRSITNYFTRMRFCTKQGCLDLEDKNSVQSEREGFKAWFQFNNEGLAKHHDIIFGHWAALEGVTESTHHHALDTGCVWGGQLTAMNIDTKQRFIHTG